VTVNDVIAAVGVLPDKTCALDPQPTTHLKAVVGVIALFLTSLFNKSLLSGFVPEAFKVTHITRLVKKSGMDTGDVRSYRPISSLSVASKLLERIAAQQLIAYLEKSALLPRLQSAYRTDHSSETAVLKVLSDILLGIHAGDLSALVLLDLSPAFDTVDHHILLQRLDRSYGITGLVRQWFQSYLVGRRQFVRTGSSTSSVARLLCMWRTTGVGPWTDPVLVLHCRLATAY